MDKTQYLGWGLLGTPKGRVQLGTGIDKEIKFAKNFDLDQNYGECLPSPTQDEDFTPLYCVLSRQLEQYHVLGVAEYRSIYEKGQTRAGTYFGSFVETINTGFDTSESSIERLLSVLLEISKYQLSSFIDDKTRAYKESFIHSEVPDIADINKLAQGLNQLPPNYFSQVLQQGDLYIHCDQGELIGVLKIILETGLYRLYKHILFSESRYISRQMRTKKISWISAHQLEQLPLFTEPYQQEIGYLHAFIKNLDTEKQQVELALQQFKVEQENLINIEIEKRSQAYIDRAEQAEGKVEQVLKLAQDNQLLAQLGQQVLAVVGENAEGLGKVNLAKFAKRDFEQEILQKLTALSHHISVINQSIVPSQDEYVKQSNNAYKIWSWIFGGFSVILLAVLVGQSIWWAISDDKTLSSEEFNKLKESSQKVDTLIEENKKLSQDKKSIEVKVKTLENSKQKFKEFCYELSNKERLECLELD